eukprot:CAMPEP_0168495208 /NCGR_PEP_ID=MMETSP0228-20121227/71623_1 /TAXON_ID=133427 /ORGANISM="Protoceratium reticulatum, Strain CCCM 535 (=CCMP 1889)" /LENGTH=60 /DNA_ID=CAMNT_0008512029 /DNA_START=1 /DNA_END=181 /DNA_ORIENTATION=-
MIAGAEQTCGSADAALGGTKRSCHAASPVDAQRSMHLCSDSSGSSAAGSDDADSVAEGAR